MEIRNRKPHHFQSRRKSRSYVEIIPHQHDKERSEHLEQDEQLVGIPDVQSFLPDSVFVLKQRGDHDYKSVPQTESDISPVSSVPYSHNDECDERGYAHRQHLGYLHAEMLLEAPAELLEHAKAESFGTEFLDYKMAVKTVKSFEDALGHIQENSSKHSECIVTESKERAALFTKIVDAACVYTNVSTAFTDGAQFGLGAEIGISTQKLHARGPMGLEEITSYKWVIEGDGQTRRN